MSRSLWIAILLLLASVVLSLLQSAERKEADTHPRIQGEPSAPAKAQAPVALSTLQSEATPQTATRIDVVSAAAVREAAMAGTTSLASFLRFRVRDAVTGAPVQSVQGRRFFGSPWSDEAMVDKGNDVPSESRPGELTWPPKEYRNQQFLFKAEGYVPLALSRVVDPQGPPIEEEVRLEPAASLRVTLFDAAGGRVTNFRVWLVPKKDNQADEDAWDLLWQSGTQPDPLRRTTDENGTAWFRGFRAGRYSLRLLNHEQVDALEWPLLQEVTLEAGRTLDLTFRLENLANLLIRVSSGGRGVANAELGLWNPSTGPQGVPMLLKGRLHAQDGGELRIPHLTRGKYVLGFRPDESSPWAFERLTVEPGEQVHEARVPSGAIRVRFAGAPPETELLVTLALNDATSWAGWSTAKTGESNLEWIERNRFYLTKAKSDGVLRISGLMPGKYGLLCKSLPSPRQEEGPSKDARRLTGCSQPFVVGEGITDVGTIRLEPKH